MDSAGWLFIKDSIADAWLPGDGHVSSCKNWDFNLHDFDQALTGATLHTALFRVKTGATQSLCRKFN